MAARVRLAQHDDLAALAAIENNADQLLIDWLRPAHWGSAASGESRASGPGFILVAELDDVRLAGFVHVLEANGVCHLDQLAVSPPHTRRGIGRALVEAAKHQSRLRGHGRISLRTYADIPWNGPFYGTAGFVEEEPSTPFHRSLIVIEEELGLDRYGRRIQMTAQLD